MPTILWPDPRLTEVAAPRPVDAGLRDTGERLLAAVSEAQAYGLAAAHIGEVAPVVVVSLSADAAQRDYRLLFNPEVLSAATEMVTGMEGSVSLPGIQVEISRPAWCELRFDDADGTSQALRLEGWPARVAQHEIEQMRGIFFLERLSRLKRDMALKKWKKRAG